MNNRLLRLLVMTIRRTAEADRISLVEGSRMKASD
jgi:hypothetical protein